MHLVLSLSCVAEDSRSEVRPQVIFEGCYPIRGSAGQKVSLIILSLIKAWTYAALGKALIGCLLRSPSQLDVRTGGSQHKLTAKQLTRLPCLVVYVKFKFVYTTKSKMGSQLLLASTSSHVQL